MLQPTAIPKPEPWQCLHILCNVQRTEIGAITKHEENIAVVRIIPHVGTTVGIEIHCSEIVAMIESIETYRNNRVWNRHRIQTVAIGKSITRNTFNITAE